MSRILITGTTSGIGRALLDHYVTCGAEVIAVNRRRVEELERRYPTVRFECIDVRSADDVGRLVRDLSEAGQLPETFILNAGINRVDNDESFQLAACKEVIETNLYGVFGFISPLTELPPGPVPRHIVAVSSMVLYAGSPYSVGYSASKRALTSSFDVWSRMYSGTDLVFQQVLLGPVSTGITALGDELPEWIAWTRSVVSATPEGAARAIARFALTRKRRLIYPWRALPLFLGARFGQRLVPGLLQGRHTLDGRRRRPGPRE